MVTKVKPVFPSPNYVFHNTLPDNYGIPNASTTTLFKLPTFIATSCQHSTSCFTCPLPDCTYPK